MTGSPIFQIIQTTKFERTFSKLRKKKYKRPEKRDEFTRFVEQLLRDLCSDPGFQPESLEPLPSNVSLSEGLEFRKLRFKMEPRLEGSSEYGRLMYLVNYEQKKIALLWIYTHEEFPKRPPDQDLRKEINEGLTLLSDKEDSLNNN